MIPKVGVEIMQLGESMRRMMISVCVCACLCVCVCVYACSCVSIYIRMYDSGVYTNIHINSYVHTNISVCTKAQDCISGLM